MSSDDAFLAASATAPIQLHRPSCHTASSTMRRPMDAAQPWRAEYRALEASLYDGTAGVGLFLARLAVVTGDAAAHRTAVGAMRHAVARAQAMPPGRRRRHHLCGLSHGAAGIGWALVELFDRTGDERFRVGATAAFAYERSWLDALSGTWPDLRIGGQRRGAARRAASPALGTWCHGEGGIALTRLRAIDVPGMEACGDDAGVALEATRRDLAGALPYEIGDLTLCHGAAGAADVLLCGAATLGERSRDAAKLAPQLGHLALERYGATGDRWPCDAAGGTTPALFRGISGIGWWFLRLHDREIPSPLTMPFHG